jgi:glucokinase
MALLGIDLGGTKLAVAEFSGEGSLNRKHTVAIGDRTGHSVGTLIRKEIRAFMKSCQGNGCCIGISVPGIYHSDRGTVWAPNIPGWDDYPLLEEVREVAKDAPVVIDSDRACYILGEVWQGNARGSRNAIFMAVGTGIGAGIIIDGEVIHGSHDIAGAIGWMALDRPFMSEYTSCGCFEYHASGEGIGKIAGKYLEEATDYKGMLREKNTEELSSYDVFKAYRKEDPLAMKVINDCVEFWGMAVANLVSLFNPEKIILGGGIFGPAVSLIPKIRDEASKWAQPVSMKQVTIEPSALSGDAGVFGAAYLALKKMQVVAHV